MPNLSQRRGLRSYDPGTGARRFAHSRSSDQPLDAACSNRISMNEKIALQREVARLTEGLRILATVSGYEAGHKVAAHYLTGGDIRTMEPETEIFF